VTFPFRPLGLWLVGPLLASPLCAQSYQNDTGGSVVFYGQASPTYLGVNDGEQSYDDLADNARSNTRLGFNVDQTLQTSQLRFTFETALGAPQSSAFSQTSDPDWDWERTDIRKLEVIWSGDYGILYLGQGPMASDNTSNADLSRTTMGGSVTTSDTAGSYAFRLDGGALSDIRVSNVFNDFDGGRRARIRLDTPKVFGVDPDGGVRLAVAYGEEVLNSDSDAIYYDIGLHYDDKIGAFELVGGANYGWKDDNGITESYAGSLSVLHAPTGLNATVAGGGAPDGGHYLYGKLGWLADFWSGGATAFSADYYGGQDFNLNGSNSDAWGVQVAQYVDDAGLQVYASFLRMSYDDSAAGYASMDATLAGLRWSF
jgi:hypothetical protein